MRARARPKQALIGKHWTQRNLRGSSADSARASSRRSPTCAAAPNYRQRADHESAAQSFSRTTKTREQSRREKIQRSLGRTSKRRCRTKARTSTSPAKPSTSMIVAQQERMLEVWPVCSPHAHAKILAPRCDRGARDAGHCGRSAGGRYSGFERCRRGAARRNSARRQGSVLSRPNRGAGRGRNARSSARAAAAKVVVEYEPLPPIFTIEEAIAAKSFHTEPNSHPARRCRAPRWKMRR